MLKFYGDESVDLHGQVMNVSGFVMKEDQFTYLDEAVRDIRGDLPYFHMCEGHYKSHPDIYAKLCALLSKQNVLAGISASLQPEAHKAIAKHKFNGQSLSYWCGTTYTYLLNLAMFTCNDWLTNYKPSDEFVAYVFEGGHPNQGDASAFMNLLYQPRLKETRDSYRYASHTFIDGKGPLGSVLQLADIFAWHMNREALGECSLKDVSRLFSMPILTREHSLQDIAETLAAHKNVWDPIKREWTSPFAGD